MYLKVKKEKKVNRPLSSVASTSRVSHPVEAATPAHAVLRREHGSAQPVAAPPRSEARRGSSYIGKSYLTRSRYTGGGARTSMFRIR